MATEKQKSVNREFAKNIPNIGVGKVITTVDGINPTWEDLSGGTETFIELADVPNSYVGEAGMIVAVNATEDGLEFISPSAGSGLTQPEVLKRLSFRI